MNEELLTVAAAALLQRSPEVEAAQLKADTARADLAAEALQLEEEQEAQRAGGQEEQAQEAVT